MCTKFDFVNFNKTEDGSSFVLDNIMYIPELRGNLISMGRLGKEGRTLRMQRAGSRSPTSSIVFEMPIDMLGIFGWLASIKQLMLEPVKVKCIFLGYREGIVGNKLYREQHSTRELLRYNEENNKDAFVVAAVEKIYTYESLSFNDIVASEVISK
ncbi:hypothetical protein Tco_0312570 [Tanacetum coccineum]